MLMKKILQHSYKAGILLMIILLASCISQKKMEYFREMEKQDSTKTTYNNKRLEYYLIQPGDNLYIRVVSTESKAYTFEQERGAVNYYTEAGIYLNSYSVTDSGYVNFPLIGKIFVHNKTVNELRVSLQHHVDEYVKNTTVIVKLANFRVTLLGEFYRPGKYMVYQDNITIFQAIAMAGDMTDYAKRSEVVLVRQTKTGSKMYHLNLNDQNILESNFYYLMPNDIVYVGPLKGKQFAFATFPYALLLSSITVLLLVLTYTK